MLFLAHKCKYTCKNNDGINICCYDCVTKNNCQISCLQNFQKNPKDCEHLNGYTLTLSGVILLAILFFVLLCYFIA